MNLREFLNQKIIDVPWRVPLQSSSTSGEEDKEHELECLLSIMSTHPFQIEFSTLDWKGKEEQLIDAIYAILLQKQDQQQHFQHSTTILQLLDPDLVTALQYIVHHILPKLTPFQLHATVQQAIIVWGGEENSKDHPIENPSLLFTIICLILCCHALIQCKPKHHDNNNNNNSSSSSSLPRKERWRSLLWETLRLFQQYANNNNNNNNKFCYNQELCRSSLLFLHVWNKCILPAVACVYDGLCQTTTTTTTTKDPKLNSKEKQFQVAYVASTIATTSQVLYQLLLWNTSTDYNSDDDPKDIDPKLIHLTNQCMESISYHVLHRFSVGDSKWDYRYLLACHPWRKRVLKQNLYSHLQQQEPSSETLLTVYTSFMNQITKNDHEMDEQDHTVLSRLREDICYVDSNWNETGIALLVSSYWTNRPLVWSWKYQWRLFFPHLASLLHEQEEFKPNNMNNSMDGQVLLYKEQVEPIAFDLLISLIQIAQPASLTVSNTFYDAPLSPIGLFQLISNRVIARSVVQPSSGLLLSTGQLYQHMKDLLSIYTPQTQYDLIHTLVQTCPHPGMKPMLLDLWRGFVAWQDTKAVHLVLSHLESRYIQPLATTYTNPSDCKKGLVNIEQLVSSVEMFVAALGLLQIWVKIKSSEKYVIAKSFMPWLNTIKSSLEATFERWDQHRANRKYYEPPEESYRLYLLDDSITVLIQLLT